MIAIEFENISKQYQLGKIGTGTLSKDLNRWWARIRGKEDPYLKIGQVNDRTKHADSEFVWALRDINLKIEQGDVVGIIGKNGSGKSTLLKILSKITAPTTGVIRGRGRVASLLEVGTGFHPEMTGRENIYMNGAIMGMTKHEIDRKLDEIVDFAGVEMYLDTPVKRYSSGMTVRLGFAIAAHLEPEILVVDEVLAVGDAEFQKKAIGKMQDVSKGQGRTVLFVSHNMGAVRNLCHSGIVLSNGLIEYLGKADDCVDRYLKNETQNSITKTVISDKHRLFKGSGEIEIKEVELLNETPQLSTNEPIQLKLKLHRNLAKIEQSQVFVGIRDNDERLLYYSSSPIILPTDSDDISIKIIISNHNLAENSYSLDIEIGQMDFTRVSTIFDRVFRVIVFEVCYFDYRNKEGFINWNSKWGKIIHQPQPNSNDNILVELL